MFEPLVSVIIPCYNHARFLPESVESALAQTYPHVEVLVIDDGSTDETREVASRYGDRIRYIYQENAGLAAARNTGIREARGELIGLLDADDRWLPRKLEVQVPHFAEPAVGLAHTSYRKFPPPDYPEKEWLVPEGAGPTYLDELRLNRIGVLTAVFRRALALEVGGFDETLRSCEDWDLWTRLIERSQAVGCAEVLAEYRLHPGSMSTNAERMFRSRLRVLEKNRQRHPGDAAVQAAVQEGERNARYQYYAEMWRHADTLQGQGHRFAAFRLRLLALRRHPWLLRGLQAKLAKRLGLPAPPTPFSIGTDSHP